MKKNTQIGLDLVESNDSTPKANTDASVLNELCECHVFLLSGFHAGTGWFRPGRDCLFFPGIVLIQMQRSLLYSANQCLKKESFVGCSFPNSSYPDYMQFPWEYFRPITGGLWCWAPLTSFSIFFSFTRIYITHSCNAASHSARFNHVWHVISVSSIISTTQCHVPFILRWILKGMSVCPTTSTQTSDWRESQQSTRACWHGSDRLPERY